MLLLKTSYIWEYYMFTQGKKIKIEEEHLPSKFPKLLPNSSAKDSSEIAVDVDEGILSRISTVEKSLESTQEKLEGVLKSNGVQQDTIIAWEKKCTSLTTKNQELEEALKSQKIEHQQRIRELENGLKAEADSRSTLKLKLDTELQGRLTTQDANLTSMINQRYTALNSKTDLINATLTKVEQNLQQEINARLAKESDWSNKYNNHTHDTEVAGVGACAEIAGRHGHAWGHTHTANTKFPKPRF